VARRALAVCREAPWPGNVRQLAHAIEAAVIRAHGDGSLVVGEHHVFPSAERAEGADAPLTFQDATRRCQRRYLHEALAANDWNVAKTARELDLARSHLYTLISAFDLRRDDAPPEPTTPRSPP
jgi:Nif-specific regulatory protein